MIKNSQNQNGSANIAIVVVLVVALIGALCFIFWQNFISKGSAREDLTVTTKSAKDSSNSTVKTSSSTVDDAVASINKVLLEKGCSGSGMGDAIPKDAFKEVDDSATYSYQGGVSKINKNLTYAFVQYSCGSQGSVALLQKTNDEWILVSEDARVYPMCDAVRGKNFPTSIIDKCYTDDRAAEPVVI